MLVLLTMEVSRFRNTSLAAQPHHNSNACTNEKPLWQSRAFHSVGVYNIADSTNKGLGFDIQCQVVYSTKYKKLEPHPECPYPSVILSRQASAGAAKDLHARGSAKHRVLSHRTCRYFTIKPASQQFRMTQNQDGALIMFKLF